MLGLLARKDAPDGALDMMLEIGDSVMTHRRQYTVQSGRRTVIDLLALDPLNPRSVLFQLERLKEEIGLLPGRRQRRHAVACRQGDHAAAHRRWPFARRPTSTPRRSTTLAGEIAGLYERSSPRPISPDGAAMQYDIRLTMHYDYDYPVGGGRHHIRMLPLNLAGVQRVVAASLAVTPTPAERSDFTDFFGNHVTSIAVSKPHDELDVRMSARVAVTRPAARASTSRRCCRELADEIAAVWSLAPGAPHHFLTGSSHAGIDPAHHRLCGRELCRRPLGRRRWPSICATASTPISPTTPRRRPSPPARRDAFKLKRGVCQDFSHVMIAGLRGLGVPAGYVSGFLRTIPPPGKERLEGADAMHAWVRVWCGREAGWLEFDPTNGMRAGDDHITVGYGRDYSRRRADRRHRQDRRRPGDGAVGGRGAGGGVRLADLQFAAASKFAAGTK